MIRWFILAVLLISFSLNVLVTKAALQWEVTNYCKCICFSNYTIRPLLRPEDPSKPCLSCTKQWCLDQKLDICRDAELGEQNPDTATGKEGDVEARCFQRDSPRDQLVVTLFLLIVFGLLLGAAIKGRMEKAGFRVDPAMAWDAGRKWWDTIVPGRQTNDGPSFPLGSRGRDEYEPVLGIPRESD